MPGEKGPQDACGVFGVWAPGEEVAKLTFFGLYALQHRGQEAAGMAVSDGSSVLVYKDLGLVSQVFDEATLASLKGHIAVGHNRYSTTGSANWENAQPSFRTTAAGTGLALGHNGNLVNTADLARQVARLHGARRRAWAPPPTPTWSPRCSPPARTCRSSRPPWRCCPRCGARSPSSSWTSTRCTPPATRRAFARWCWAASTGAGSSPASPRRWTSSAPRSSVRSSPGELIAIDEDGLRSQHFAAAEPKGCLFEYVYVARPDTTIAGRNVHATRIEIGRRLAREHPVEADLVIPVPESGTPAAIGYAEESGIPYGLGLVKNSYVGRTFIQPSQTIRQLGIRLKLNPLRDVIRGKRLVVVDDSIVRGNTQRALIAHAARGRRARGARAHRLAAGQVAVLLRHRLRLQGRTAGQRPRRSRTSGPRSARTRLGYVSLEDWSRPASSRSSRLCRACFDGEYPIPLPDLIGKHVLEGIERNVVSAGLRRSTAGTAPRATPPPMR